MTGYMGRIVRFLTGIIPQYVPVRFLSAYLRLVSIPMPRRVRRSHEGRNCAVWRRLSDRACVGGYVERQHLLSDMRYGFMRASANCCSAIAAYNAVLSLCRKKTTAGTGLMAKTRSRKANGDNGFPSVISAFERQGLVLGGLFGTATDGCTRYFKEHGYVTNELWGSQITPQSVARLADFCDTFVLTMYNDAHNVFAQVHTVCITKEDNGYAVHNAGIHGKRLITLYDAIGASHGGKGRPILLTGISFNKSSTQR